MKMQLLGDGGYKGATPGTAPCSPAPAKGLSDTSGDGDSDGDSIDVRSISPCVAAEESAAAMGGLSTSSSGNKQQQVWWLWRGLWTWDGGRGREKSDF